MREYLGWYFPDMDSHFPKMLQKSVDKGGPAEYQYQVRNRSLTYCQQRRIALDIGANVGLWSRNLCANFSRVIAFEPVGLFRQCLLMNVPAANLQVESTALGDSPGRSKMIITEGNTGHSHLDPEFSTEGDTEIRTLDSYGLCEVDYIKIDCEGYEYRVLQGAKHTVITNKPIVVVEQKPHDMYQSQWTQHAAVSLLQQWGMTKLDQVKDDWIMGWT